MKFRNPEGRELAVAYVASAHPAPDVEGICAALDLHAGRVRQLLDVPRLGITLVIPDLAAVVLDNDPQALEDLRATADRNHIDVTAIHGVPVRMYDPKRRYGVFRPDWAEPERLEHTLRLARILAHLLPEDAEAGLVSTIPFFWRTREDSGTRAAAHDAIYRLQDGLAEQASQSGRLISVVMEPEPGCAVETSTEVATWLDPLILDTREGLLGVVLDTCHMAVQYEDTSGAVDLLTDVSPAIRKLQIANGLKIENPPRQLDWLEQFVDPGRLHQTRERRPDGKVWGVDDLSAALPGGLPGDSEWRIHYHMPVHLHENTTQEITSSILHSVVSSVPSVTNLETETYTWPMLPHHLRPPGADWLARGVALELAWLRDELEKAGYSSVA